MKCVAVNKDIAGKKQHELGRKRASEKVELYLRYALADKRGYSNNYITRVFSSINKVIEDVTSGKTSVANLKRCLEEKHNAVIGLGDNRIKPQKLNRDFVSGVYSFMDEFNIILIYVLLEKYRMGGEKVNMIMEYISNGAQCCNMGYATEEDIEQVLLNEDNVPAQEIKMIKRHS